MIIKRKLTEVAVDAFAEYLQEKLEKLKEFDLDKDGRKDVDQVAAIVKRCSSLAKDAIATTDFSQIAAGLELIINGATAIRNSIDREKLTALSREAASGMSKVGELAQLTIQYVKEQDNSR